MSKIEVDNIDTVTGTSELTIGGTNATSITLGSGASFSNVSGQNYPAFEAYLSANQSISDNVITKVQIDTEVFDTDSCYDNTTNYRFTPTVAGKYYVYGSIGFDASAATAADYLIGIYKNGGLYRSFYEDPPNDVLDVKMMTIFAIVEMNGSTDYLSLHGRLNVTSGSPIFASGIKRTVFGAFRIGS